MDFITLTIEFLKFLSNLFGGNLGIGIILLTIIVRMAMWSLSFSQQKSMREMQRFQPEMKRIQDRFKSDPQRMQQEMMTFYKKHNFNPMGGCLPLFIQMPIFILLYSALISPQFISLVNGQDSHFLFINRLDTTLKGTTGQSNDGVFEIGGKNDIFVINKDKVNITLIDGNEIENVKTNSKKALVVMGEIEPGQDIDFKISLDNLEGLKFAQLEKVKSAKVSISDRTTREIEEVEFQRDGDILKASVPTKTSSNGFHLDVLLLIVIFGLTMFFSQKFMMSTQKNKDIDPQQAAMQKMMGFTMPIMLTGTFFFIPIPAGVLLYLVVSNIFQVGQTVIINKQLDKEEEMKKNNINNDDIIDAKKVEVKDVKTIDGKEIK
ncbi:membrane protein insertase YidC [bacterium]|nr:membrane protein insertase YidC [bacterium]